MISLSFVFTPLAMMWGVIELINRNRFSVVIVALSIAVYGFYMTPTESYDLYRHFYNYEMYALYGKSLENSKDLFLLFLYWLGSLLNLDPGFIPFLSAFIFYYFLLSIFFDSTKSLNVKYRALFLFLYLLVVPIVFFTGLRFSTGLILFSYSFVCVKHKNTVRVLSVFAHFSLIIPLLILVFSKAFRGKFNKLNISVLILFFFFVGLNPYLYINVIAYFLDAFNSSFGVQLFSIDTYIYGEWGLERLNSKNLTGLFFYVLNSFFLVLIMLISVYNNVSQINHSPVVRFNFFLVLFLLLTISLSTVFLRFSLLFVILSIYANAIYFKKNLKTYALIFIIVFNFLVRRVVELSSYHEFILSPLDDLVGASMTGVIYKLIVGGV